MSVKLLLDENLSPAAAVALIADGIDACHVRDRGILGATDEELLERAYRELGARVCDESLAVAVEIDGDQ